MQLQANLDRTHWVQKTALVPLPLLAAAIILLSSTNTPQSFESPFTLFILNFIFLTLGFLFIACLAAKSFVANGRLGYLLLGCSALIWGTASFVAAVTLERSANVSVTIYNVSVAASASLNLVSTYLLVRSAKAVRFPVTWMCGAYICAVGFVAFLAAAAFQEWTPAFYIQGQGWTSVRQMVLISAISMLFLTAVMLGLTQRHSRSVFPYWYALGLALLGLGLAGVTVASTHGGLVGWVGRSTQYLGGVYLLIAAFCSVRESKAWHISIEQELRQTEERYRSLFNGMAEAFAFQEPVRDANGCISDWRFLEVNPAFERLVGMACNQIRGNKHSDIFPHSDPGWLAMYERVAATGAPARFETCCSTLKKHFEVFAYQPVPGQFAVILMDNSARREVEEQLRQKIEELEKLMDLAPAAIWVSHDPGCKLITGNRTADRFYEATPRENVSASDPAVQNVRRFFRNGDELRPDELPMQEAAAKNTAVHDSELDILLPSGYRKTILGSATPLRDAHGNVRGCMGIFLDITERKWVEKRLKLLAETAAALLSTASPQTIVDELCRKTLEVLDCDVFFNFLVNEKMGKLRLNACAGIPDETARQIEWLDYGTAVCGCAARDGCRIVAEDIPNSRDPRTDLVRSFGIKAYACHPLKVGNRVLGTLSFGTRNRSRFTDEELNVMRAVAGQVAIAMERQRAQAELQQVNTELEERVLERTAKLQEALAELQHFSYTLTHDMRAPLRAMKGYGDLLVDETSSMSDNGRVYLNRITAAAERMDKLITDALDYSLIVKDGFSLSSVDPVRLLHDIVVTYDLQPPRAQIEIAPDMPLILANEAGLTQCFSNILNNAVKFVRPGETPRITVWWEPKGDNVRLCFHDNGIGIPHEYHERIFQMFQRLSTDYEGTGIGLALVRKAAERMQGRVGVESEPGQGSCFWLEFKRPI